jgi:hypothetical protein
MASNPRRPSRSRDDRPSTVGIRVKPYGVKPAAADTGPTVTSSVAVYAENLLTNGPVSARGLTGRWPTPVMGTLLWVDLRYSDAATALASCTCAAHVQNVCTLEVVRNR